MLVVGLERVYKSVFSVLSACAFVVLEPSGEVQVSKIAPGFPNLKIVRLELELITLTQVIMIFILI